MTTCQQLKRKTNLVFTKVAFDPLTTPNAFASDGNVMNINVDDDWTSPGTDDFKSECKYDKSDIRTDEKKEDCAHINPYSIENQEYFASNSIANENKNEDKTQDMSENDSESGLLKIEEDFEERRNRNRKKIDWRQEMTSAEIDVDLLLPRNSDKHRIIENVEKVNVSTIDEHLLAVDDEEIDAFLLEDERIAHRKQNKAKALLAEMEDMFVKEDEHEIENDDELNVVLNTNVNVDEEFNFEAYIKQQNTIDS